MRGSIDGLTSARPIGELLPAVFAEDDLAQRFVGGLDEVLAPILAVLDCLDAYFTPALAPVDHARWLGGWVGAETDGGEPEDRLRRAVAAAARLHRIRGTREGLAEAVRLGFGVLPDISESGAAAWSSKPLGPVPGAARPHLTVTLRLPRPTPADRHRLDVLVAAARPAHMPYTTEIIATEVIATEGNQPS
ncbi:Phage tail protein OS=Streptomyces alboniger OX=132473 GN=CP975_27650 PE=4 SV=1 [Streptomyces alboniger]